MIANLHRRQVWQSKLKLLPTLNFVPDFSQKFVLCYLVSGFQWANN